MREKQKRVIENFIASLDLEEPNSTTRKNVELEIKLYGFNSREAHNFRVFVAAARVEGKAGALRDLANV